MRALFDVNVLIALFDTAHVFHRTALGWWSANSKHGWASCPLTQNGFLRIVTQRGYPRPVPLPDAFKALRLQVSEPGHAFWTDDFSLLDASRVDHRRILTGRHLRDVYLLALAVKNGGRLITTDRGLPRAAVVGAEAEHCVVI